jgi:hypothetical protein
VVVAISISFILCLRPCFGRGKTLQRGKTEGGRRKIKRVDAIKEMNFLTAKFFLSLLSSILRLPVVSVPILEERRQRAEDGGASSINAIGEIPFLFQ